MKLQTKIKKYSKMLVAETLKDGREIVVFSKDANEELKSAVYEASQYLPMDWVFETFCCILDAMLDYDIETLNDIDDARAEIVDSLVDVYTKDLTEWLNSSLNFVQYLEMACESYGSTGNILGTAQYMAIDEVFSEVVNLLNK